MGISLAAHLPLGTLAGSLYQVAHEGDCGIPYLSVGIGPDTKPVVYHLLLAPKMKNRAVIVLIVVLFIFAGLVARWTIINRNARREWPNKQLRNAILLGAALSRYQQAHGSCPEQLEDLVAAGTVDKASFDRLQFRAEPNANPANWLYKSPNRMTDIAIVGPKATFPWSGHSGYIVTARADGGGELISGTKMNRIPAWATK